MFANLKTWLNPYRLLHTPALWQQPLPAEGIVAGLDQFGRARVYDGNAHVCVIGPSRSGKGVNSVVPSLLSMQQHSVVILDVKGELYEATAGYRSQFGPVYRFDPTTHHTCHIDPLLMVRKGEHQTADMMLVSDVLVEASGEGKDHPHWAQTAKSFLTALGLHQLYAGEAGTKSFGGMLDYITRPGRTVKEMLQAIHNTLHHTTHVDPVIARILYSMLQRPAMEQSSILSTTERALRLWNDPFIARATDTTDIDFKDLQYGEQPVSLYFCVPPSSLARLKPLSQVIWTLLLNSLTSDIPPPTAWPLWLFMDEFAAMGRLEIFEKALPYLAGYKIQTLMVVQSTEQIDALYGEHNALLDNCPMKIVFRPNNERQAKRISEWVGQHIIWRQSISQQHGTSRTTSLENMSLGESASVTLGWSERLEYLLRPDEIMRLPADIVLLFRDGEGASLAHRLAYYADSTWQGRVSPAPELPVHGATAPRTTPWDTEAPKVPVVVTTTIPPGDQPTLDEEYASVLQELEFEARNGDQHE